MSGNLIQVSFGETPEATVLKRGSCFHGSYAIDTETRQILCQGCDKELNAFDVLLEYARKERNFLGTLEAQRRKKEELVDSVDELLKEEKRIKARIKNASKKDTEAAVRQAKRVGAEYLRRARGQLQDIERQASKALGNVDRAMGEQ